MYIWLVVDLPLWKIWKSVGIILPKIWRKKHVPNHQPDIVYLLDCWEDRFIWKNCLSILAHLWVLECHCHGWHNGDSTLVFAHCHVSLFTCLVFVPSLKSFKSKCPWKGNSSQTNRPYAKPTAHHQPNQPYSTPIINSLILTVNGFFPVTTPTITVLLFLFAIMLYILYVYICFLQPISLQFCFVLSSQVFSDVHMSSVQNLQALHSTMLVGEDKISSTASTATDIS